MRKLILLFALIATIAQAQTIQKGLLILNEGRELKVENAILDSYGKQLTYIQNGGEVMTVPLDQITSIKEKRGNYWLPGLLGGFAGSLLASAITAPKDGEWYYGAGPKILLGTAAGTIAGILIPKYKEISIGEGSTIAINLTGIKFNF